MYLVPGTFKNRQEYPLIHTTYSSTLILYVQFVEVRVCRRISRRVRIVNSVGCVLSVFPRVMSASGLYSLFPLCEFTRGTVVLLRGTRTPTLWRSSSLLLKEHGRNDI